MQTVIMIVALLVLMVLALFVIPQWRVSRAVRNVIRIFRALNAVDSKTARSIEDLGLQPRGIMEGMLKGRDYKPHALKSMIDAGIVQVNEDRKLYLSEEKLLASSLEQGKSVYRYH